MILIKNIFFEANNKTEESLDSHTLLDYLNSGIVSINSYCNLKVPTIKHDDYSNTYSISISDDQFIDDLFKQILLWFVCYQILQGDNYRLSENDYYAEYRALLIDFNKKFISFVKEEFRINPNLISNPKREKSTGSLIKKRPLW